MTKDDAAMFAEELAKTAELFGQALSEPRVIAYFEALADVEIDDLVAGLTWCRKHGRFFPSPGEVREHGSDGSPEDQATLRWAVIAGADKAFQLDPSEKVALDAIGGWVTVLEGPAARFGQFATVFVRTYCAEERAQQRDMLRQLAPPEIKSLPR